MFDNNHDSNIPDVRKPDSESVEKNSRMYNKKKIPQYIPPSSTPSLFSLHQSPRGTEH